MKMKHLIQMGMMDRFFSKMAELRERNAKVTDIKIEGGQYTVKFDVPEDEPLDIVQQIRRKNAGPNHYPKPQ